MYQLVSVKESLTQGDIVEGCPVTILTRTESGWAPEESFERVLVLTQACDIANNKVTRVQAAVIQEAEKLVQLGSLSRATIRDHVRLHRVFGLYFLPEWGAHMPESIVDLRDLHTIPLELINELVAKNDRVRLTTPYREHLAQHFAVTYSRIALPEPYQTK